MINDKETEFVKVSHEEAEAEQKAKFTEKKIIHTALASYGADKQRIKCVEELGELVVELTKDANGNGSRFHIVEEIADVEIMLAQMKIHYGAEKDVEAVKAQKIKQLGEKLGIKCNEIRQDD